MTSTASLERKRAALELKKQQRNKALLALTDLEKKEVEAHEKLYESIANKIAWYALSQPVKVFATKDGQRVMIVDNQATRKLRSRVLVVWKMIKANHPVEEIMDALIEFLTAEKARLTGADKRYGRPPQGGDER